MSFPTYDEHPLAATDRALTSLLSEIVAAKTKLLPTAEARDVSALDWAKVMALKCLSPVGFGAFALSATLKDILEHEGYWRKLAALLVFGDAADKLRKHLSTAWTKKNAEQYFNDTKPPSAFLDSRRKRL
ncbi:MAG: hypothetical protein E6R04_05910 [Spirochaetes bacterium]|nr:MAG: hypothetical protein E6R04_05910 [Spirochaetota bacterium]